MKTTKSPANERGTVKSFAASLTGRVRLAQATLAAILFAISVVSSPADLYTISARDTSLQIDTAGGLSQWLVDGVNQLNEQSFFYSIGSGAAASIYTIGLASAPTLTTNISKTIISLSTSYSDSTISVGTLFSLQSQPVGSGKATLASTLTINNLSATAQVFHFYQYSDFDLGGVSGGQNIQFSSNGSGQPYQVVQTDAFGRSLTGLITGVTGGTSAQTEVQAGYYDGTRFGLGGGGAVTLNNTFTAGPGDVVYAYEWDATLAPGSSLTISETQSVVVPEPSSLALGMSGVLALAWFRRRQRGG
ncbi:MAG TPA: PEP-CTERM sorting domain-containing protein [Candidatus Acidoferrum sp.]|nr:PEP-CTERM sorting domain-containing protein [Candidatus Acidoferrum sp.]